MPKSYLLNKIAEKKKQPSAAAKPAAVSTPKSSAKSGNTLLYNASTQQDEAYRDPTLKKNQVAARVASTASPTVNSANTVQAAARGTVTGTRLTAPKSPILQATAAQAAPTAEPSEKKTVSKLAAALKNTLLSRSGSSDKNRVYDRESQTDIPLTKKALLSAELAAGMKKNAAAAKEKEPQTEENEFPQTKYGTAAIKMPNPSERIYQAVAELPDDFPFDQWDDMTTAQQKQIIETTDLSKAEQWVILNAALPIGTLREIQEYQNTDDGVWRTQAEKDLFLDRIWEAGSAIYSIKNHNHPLSYDRFAENILLDMIYEEKAAMFTEPNMDRIRIEADTRFGSFDGTLLDHSKHAIREEKERLLDSDDNRIINILYTSKGDSDFSDQAEYQKRMLEKKGYDVVMHEVNSVDEFTEAWDNMDESRAVLVFAHSNGESLIFEDNTHTNAMSWNGKNSEEDPIGNIHDLNGPEIDEVYLMSCNTANEILLKRYNSNVADAFRDLPNVSKVYGYDGSMGYGDESKIKRAIDYYITKEFNPRLSDEQGVFNTLVSKYRSMINISPERERLETPDGLFLYED